MRQFRHRITPNRHHNQTRWLWLLVLAVSLGIFFSKGSFTASVANNLPQVVKYETFKRFESQIHVVTIPVDSDYVVVPVVAGELQLITNFSHKDEANILAGINGGYFDPVNHKTTSFIVKNNQVVADPRFNERLVDNPDLKVYLGKIFNRAEFRSYHCNGQKQYDIQPHFAPIPNHCTLTASLAAGPSILPQDNSVAEAFTAYEQGIKIRDALGAASLNARSGIGITATGDIILVMAAQQAENPLQSGVSLAQLADILADLGAVKAMNLDGGSSASMFYGDRVIYGRVDKTGQKIQRPIKSVLLVTKTND